MRIVFQLNKHFLSLPGRPAPEKGTGYKMEEAAHPCLDELAI